MVSRFSSATYFPGLQCLNRKRLQRRGFQELSDLLHTSTVADEMISLSQLRSRLPSGWDKRHSSGRDNSATKSFNFGLGGSFVADVHRFSLAPADTPCMTSHLHENPPLPSGSQMAFVHNAWVPGQKPVLWSIGQADVYLWPAKP